MRQVPPGAVWVLMWWGLGGTGGRGIRRDRQAAIWVVQFTAHAMRGHWHRGKVSFPSTWNILQAGKDTEAL